ncbi:Penicillin-binding protein A [Sphingobacterium mizutaii]|uniref:Penicillin-binding protein A n=3 Tax=Sphingobacterium mizutaii TaxID=1010 RepID=A0AAJ4X9H6_9SPHI|nr:penicillin-binding protein 2 [Sphingobacterium mizutaii]SNV37714.1 Penicillin-binding protein A [Sphingobacterium mizutaii]
MVPDRGVIYDRNGKILVWNRPFYDLQVIPNEVRDIDTLSMCKWLKIDRQEFISRIERAKSYSRFKPSVFYQNISVERFAALQEHLFEYKGFQVVMKSSRYYPYGVAAHVLRDVAQTESRGFPKSDRFYEKGDRLGISGIEKAYESYLRGEKGIKNMVADVHNRPQGSFANGKYDREPVYGMELSSTLDIDLQEFGEKLMGKRKGSIVAIEPNSGEILAFVSSPTFDPNDLIGDKRAEGFKKLLNDPDKPLFVRPIQAQYPPGSVFKVVSALIAQEMGEITGSTVLNCPGGYRYGRNGYMGCTHVHGPINLSQSIQTSCNTYYGHIYSAILEGGDVLPSQQYDIWRDKVMKFGIGRRIGIDIPGEKPGLLPPSQYYSKRFGNEKWMSGYNISLSIGQGEMGITALQMANIMAIVANRGYYYTPHLVKMMDNSVLEFSRHSVEIKDRFFEPVIQGMSMAVNQPGGTAYSVRISGTEMCGKTGTAQNPHGENHAVFFGFAPRKDPKIAIAVFVENAGYGSTWAAPIGSMMIEKFLHGKVTIPDHIYQRIIN